MRLSRDSGVALWRQIGRALERDIAEGLFAPGQRLPSEHELAERFAVNRHTVRRALACLERKGSVRAERGRGTFALESLLPYPISRRTRFTENLARLSRTAAGVLLGAEIRVADRAALEALRLETGAEVLRVDTAGAENGRRISVSSHFLPLPRFAGFADAYAAERSMTAAFRRYGVDDYERSSTRVTARPPTAAERVQLDLPASRPVLVAESVNIDLDGQAIEYGVTRFNSDRVQLVFEP